MYGLTHMHTQRHSRAQQENELKINPEWTHTPPVPARTVKISPEWTHTPPVPARSLKIDPMFDC